MSGLLAETRARPLHRVQNFVTGSFGEEVFNVINAQVRRNISSTESGRSVLVKFLELAAERGGAQSYETRRHRLLDEVQSPACGAEKAPPMVLAVRYKRSELQRSPSIT